jgi:hypothetical protein
MVGGGGKRYEAYRRLGTTRIHDDHFVWDVMA